MWTFEIAATVCKHPNHCPINYTDCARGGLLCESVDIW